MEFDLDKFLEEIQEQESQLSSNGFQMYQLLRKIGYTAKQAVDNKPVDIQALVSNKGEFLRLLSTTEGFDTFINNEVLKTVFVLVSSPARFIMDYIPEKDRAPLVDELREKINPLIQDDSPFNSAYEQIYQLDCAEFVSYLIKNFPLYRKEIIQGAKVSPIILLPSVLLTLSSSSYIYLNQVCDAFVEGSEKEDWMGFLQKVSSIILEAGKAESEREPVCLKSPEQGL